MNSPTFRSAATYGLFLGLVAVVVSSISMIGVHFAVSIMLWVLKLFLTIGFLWYAMKRQSAASPSFSYNDAIVFGLMVGACSGVVSGTFSVLQITIIAPELYETQLVQTQQLIEMQWGGSFDITAAVGYFPYVIFFVTIFYYALLGLVYSLIMGWHVKHPPLPPSMSQSE